uniref:Uncharacterized protein n=1 Tax=Clastoptera arizonana TaxID=38151 RepID=A0A1B6EGU5_9HEMI
MAISIKQDGCCFCFTLPTGCQIIAVLTLLGGIMNVYGGFKSESTELQVVSGVKVITGFLAIAFGALLFHAVVENKAVLLVYWIIFDILNVTCSLILSVITVMVVPAAIPSTFILGFILIFFFNAYIVIVVYSQYVDVTSGLNSNV